METYGERIRLAHRSTDAILSEVANNFSVTVSLQQHSTVQVQQAQQEERARNSELVRLNHVISKVRMDKSKTDNMHWIEGNDGRFSVKSYYNIINSVHIPYEPVGEFDEAFSKVWRMDVPIKIKAFGWRCFIDRLLTHGALSHKGVLSDSWSFITQRYSSTLQFFLCVLLLV